MRKQLEVLEDRLDAMVQPRLTDALSSRKVTKFLIAVDLLLSVLFFFPPFCGGGLLNCLLFFASFSTPLVPMIAT